MNQTDNTYICPMCEKEYTLGVNGTVDGCDRCLHVVRNAIDNTVIDLLSEAYNKREEA